MARLPEVRLEMLRDLEEQLRFSPRDAVVRVLEHAEELSQQIDPDQVYPEEWLVHRLTGFRAGSSRRARGEEVRRELSAFAERLSAHAGLEARDAAPAVGLRELGMRWNVSDKTLQRARRDGLVAWRVRDGTRHVLVVRAPHSAWFAGAHADRLARAARYARLTPRERDRLARGARRYQRWAGLSLWGAARRLALRQGRSAESIRQVLLTREGLATPNPSISAHARAVLVRASERGVDLGLAARKWKRSRSAVRRALALGRAERLRAWARAGALAAPLGPTFDREDAGEVLLAPPAARTGLVPPGGGDPASLVRSARRARALPAGEESARAIAHHYLLFRARRILGELDPSHPSATSLDRAEIDLLWAGRLRVLLVSSQWRLVVETIEGRLNAGLESLPWEEARSFLLVGFSAAARGVALFDPFRGGRLAGAVGLEVDRALAPRIEPKPRGARASARWSPALPEWHAPLPAWHRALEPSPLVRAGWRAGTPPGSNDWLVARRFALDGLPPQTPAELAARLGIDPIRFARRWRLALLAVRLAGVEDLRARPGRAGAPA